MTFIYLLILALVQAVFEFLPVSSFFSLTALQQKFCITANGGFLLDIMLHAGGLLAIVLIFRRDILKILEEMIGMVFDLVSNLQIAVENRRDNENKAYLRVITSTGRKFAVLLLVSMIPTIFIGFFARNFVVKAMQSPMIPGLAILLNGIILLVVDFSKCGGTKAAYEATFDSAMWIGIVQGLSVFPGISRCGMTICVALLCGYSRNFAIKYSFILSIPTIIASIFVGLGQLTSGELSSINLVWFIPAMLVTAFAARICGKWLIRALTKIRLRYFALYCFAAGIYVLVSNYVL